MEHTYERREVTGMAVLVDREMPIEVWLADEAGDPGLPDLIPDWVLDEIPMSVLIARGGERAMPETPSWSPIVALQAAVEAVCALDASGLDESQALAQSEAVLECSRRLRVHELDLIAEVRSRELHELAGYPSARSWLLAVQPDADPTDVRFAEQSAQQVFLREAVAEGLVPIAAGKKVTFVLRRCQRWVDRPGALIAGLPAAEVIAGVVRNVPVLIAETVMGFAPGDHRFEGLRLRCEAILADGGGELVQLERAFTLLAELVPVERLSGLLERLFFALVPAELERQAADADARRRLELERRPDGMWRVRGLLNPECGEFVWTGLNAMLRRDPANPLDTATAQALRDQGLDPHRPETWPAEVRERLLKAADADADDLVLPRSRSEKLHDALANLCQTFLDKGLGGTHHKVPVGIVVTVTEPSATGQPGSLPAMGDSGQPIARSLLRRWWCDSSITSYVLAQGGKALRAIHTGRTLTATERRARLIEQGGQCAIAGCRGHTRGHPGPLRPHHIRRFADDHTTSLELTIMICDSCHRDLHEGGKTLRLRNGQLVNEQGWTTTIPNRPPPPF